MATVMPCDMPGTWMERCMDPSRFDALTRRLAVATSRRKVLAALSVSAVALLHRSRPASAGTCPAGFDPCGPPEACTLESSQTCYCYLEGQTVCIDSEMGTVCDKRGTPCPLPNGHVLHCAYEGSDQHCCHGGVCYGQFCAGVLDDGRFVCCDYDLIACRQQGNIYCIHPLVCQPNEIAVECHCERCPTGQIACDNRCLDPCGDPPAPG